MSEPEPTLAAVDWLLERARADLVRVEASGLAAEVAGGALVVDTRPIEQRLRDGSLPGALVIDRNVLEWRLDPTSPHRVPEVTDHTQRIILVCNEGFSSSLAAAVLHEIGLLRATDMVGGYQAWLRDGNRPGPAPRLNRRVAGAWTTRFRRSGDRLTFHR